MKAGHIDTSIRKFGINSILAQRGLEVKNS